MPAPGRSEPPSPPPPPPPGRSRPVTLALLGCAVAADSAAEPESTALSEVLGGPLAQRLSYIAEDVGRLWSRRGKTLPWSLGGGADPRIQLQGSPMVPKPKCQGREGPGGRREPVGAWRLS